jgi:hypothetical protein
VTQIEVAQNKKVPTGKVIIELEGKDEEMEYRYLFVSDVNEIQTYLQEKQIDYIMPDVPQDSFIATTILSPTRAYLFPVPPNTRIQSTSLAPLLSATDNLVSCCIMIT